MNYEKINADIIITAVCNYHNINIDLLHTKSRSKEMVTIRFTVYYLLKQYSCLKNIETAKLFNKTHGAISNGIKKANNLISYDDKYKQEINDICKILNKPILFTDILKKEYEVIIQDLVKKAIQQAVKEVILECKEKGLYANIIFNVINNDILTFIKLNIDERNRNKIYEELQINNELVTKIENYYKQWGKK